MFPVISSYHFNSVEDAIYELIDKEIFDKVMCLEHNEYTPEEIAETLNCRTMDGIPAVDFLITCLTEQEFNQNYAFVFDPEDCSPYYYIQKVYDSEAPIIGEPETAMFSSAFPANPRPFLYRILEIIKQDGIDEALKSDAVKGCLWVLNAMVYGQLATIDLYEEWSRLNKKRGGK